MDTYIEWQPAGLVIPRTAEIVSLNLRIDAGMTIELRERRSNSRWVATFEDTPIAFRQTNESYCFQLFSGLSSGRASPFLVSDDTEYLRWTHTNSQNIYVDDGWKHFAIVGEECLDILTFDMPLVARIG